MERIKPQVPVNYNGLVLLGECPGKDEVDDKKGGIPFVGRAGQLLSTTLSEIGIDRSQCLTTNVFMERPPDNKIMALFRIVQEYDAEFIARYGLYRNQVVKEAQRPDLGRLDQELLDYPPKIIVLLGATALWRIQRLNGITAARGKWEIIRMGDRLVGVMPTFHPSAVLRSLDEKLEPFVADLKAVKDVLDGLDDDDCVLL